MSLILRHEGGELSALEGGELSALVLHDLLLPFPKGKTVLLCFYE